MVSQFFLIPVTKPSHLRCILGDVNDNRTSGNRTGGRWNQRQKGLDFMKRRYAAMILGLTLALTSVNLVCAADDAATETTDTASDSTSSDTDASNDTAETTGTADAATEEDEIYGEVTAVDGSSITVNIGTLKEDAAVTEDSYGGSTETGSDTAESDSSATDDTTDSTTADDTSDNAAADDTSDSADTSDAADTGASFVSGEDQKAVLEIGKDFQTITVTDTTIYEKDALAVTAENNSGTTAEDTTDTEETASADTGSDESAADAESTDSESGTDASADVDASSDSTADTADSTASSAVTEVEVDTVDPSMTDAVSFDDIKVGDIVKITLDDEGNADTVTVLSKSPEDSMETVESVAADTAEDTSDTSDAADSTDIAES